MKLIKLFLLGILILSGIRSNAQEKVNVKIKGFVAAESYLDTRKSVNTREGAILLYPAAKSFDIEGNILISNSKI